MPTSFLLRPGFLEHPVLNLNFTSRTKAVAFADDLILVIRCKRVSEAENVTHLKMSKITACAKSNKIDFNEEKSKTIFIPRRKRKEGKETYF